jgi:hemerythrin-like domain-containing protein
MNEHRVIEQVLDCLERMADRCEDEGRLEAGPARDAVEFFRGFADRCHHGKEEHQLFPMMESQGFPSQAGPLAVMRIEHDHGRAFLRGMESAIEGAASARPEDRQAWVRYARGYLALLREHIQKEDQVLFPMADQALTAADQAELERRFERVEHEEIGHGVHEEYLRIADALAERYGVEKARTAAASHGCRPCRPNH